jgi:hypothetical protein
MRSDETGGVSPGMFCGLNPSVVGSGRLPSWPITFGGHVEACPRVFLHQKLWHPTRPSTPVGFEGPTSLRQVWPSPYPQGRLRWSLPSEVK